MTRYETRMGCRNTRTLALASIVIGSALVTASASRIGEFVSTSLSGARMVLASDPWIGVAFYGTVVALFVLLGFLVRTVAGVPDAWYAMFGGGFVGGMAWATMTMLSEPPIGPMTPVALAIGGVAGAWAAGIFGSIGFGIGSLVTKRRWRR